jgi:hypothetical protein
MKPSFPHLRRRNRKPAALAAMLAFALMLPTAIIAADDTSNEVTVDRNTFTLKFPNDWKEDTAAKDFKPDNNFTIDSAHNTYIQFNIAPKAPDTQKVLDNAVFNLDGLAITTLSKTPITQWGGYTGVGVHLKGKIMDTYPGGIRVFTFNTAHYNVLVVEFYYSQELADVQGEMDFIDQNFHMKD